MVVSSLARLVWPLLLCCGAEALRVDIGPVVSRRSFAALGALAALPANAAEGRVNLDQIKVLSAKARALRAFVRSTSSNRRLFPMEEGSNNYVNVEKGVRRGQTEVLMPLLTAMTAAAAAISLPVRHTSPMAQTREVAAAVAAPSAVARQPRVSGVTRVSRARYGGTARDICAWKCPIK